MGITGKSLVAVVVLLAFCGSAARAQLQDAPAAQASTASRSVSLSGSHAYLGLSLGRGYVDTNCAATTLFCESRDRSAQLFAGRMFGRNWGAEVGYVDTGRLVRPTGDSHAQGLNVSLVGRAQVLPAFGVFGKVGTTYGRSDTSVMGNAAAGGPDPGFGLSFGGGLSYDFTPRLSARFEWESYDLKLSSGPVRSTSLGLQYRY